jgi:CMP-N-acetylneuraminic acid synthetase
MSALALILARAGSKGVPGKNSALVGGRPCLCWSIDHARESQLITRIAITTDDAALQQLGIELGIDVVARPSALAQDTTPIDDAARHAVDALQWTGDPVVLLYANVPIRPRGLLDRALDLLVRTGCDSVQSYAPVGKYHPYWMTTLDHQNAVVSPWSGETLNNNIYRRQDLPPAFIPDGGVIACKLDALCLQLGDTLTGPHAFLGSDRRGIETNPGEVVDIDTPMDLLVSDVLLRAEGSGRDMVDLA